MSHKRSIWILAVGLSMLATWSLQDVFSQSGRKPRGKGRTASPAAVRAIDIRAEKLESDFVRNATVLAREYAEAGQLDRSKRILEAVLKLNPDLEVVRKQVESLDQTLLDSNEFEVTVDPSAGWSRPVAVVAKGRAIRIRAEGDYRFVCDTQVTPQGFPMQDPLKHMSNSVPVGALIGIVVSGGKAGKPFLIGKGVEYRPKQDGALLLRVNTPPDNKSEGSLKVNLSGNLRQT